MKLLLDTHALVWALLDPARLGRSATRLISDVENDVLVSAGSAWEIATKVRIGKMSECEALERDFVAVVEGAGFRLISIDAPTALRAARLIGVHRDPFDRMLAAHALAMDVPIVSSDAQLDQFGVYRIW